MKGAIPYDFPALRQRSGGFTRWHGSPGSASQRMRQAFVDIELEPKFLLPAGASVLTMGSCFARYIEVLLEKKGFGVPTRSLAAPSEWLVGERRQPNAFLNRFNILAMLKEFRLAFGVDQVDDNHYIPFRDGLYFDPLQAALRAQPKEHLVGLRQAVQTVHSRAGETDCVFLTLGVTETWFDSASGSPLNDLPHPFFVKRSPGRFCFRNLSYEEVEAALREIIGLLRMRAPGLKIVVTISPVPLAASYSGHDVIVSNHASKSMLRVAAEAVCRDDPDTDYYPSYEMAAYSSREFTFKSVDLRHISGDCIAAITGKFVDTYVTAGASKAAAE